MKKNNTNISGHAPGDNVHGSEFPVNTSAIRRYSDEDLSEFRGIVQSKLNEAMKHYELLSHTLRGKDANGTEDTSPSYKSLEEAGESMSREETAAQAARQKKFIEQLQNALVRIENRTFGICKISGKLIAKERLRLVPHTTMSIDAKMDMARIN